MKILFATTRFPFPPLAGDQVVSFNRLRELSKRHEIDILTFYERAEELQGLPELRKFASNIFTIRNTALSGCWQAFRGFLHSRLPFQVEFFQNPNFGRVLDRIVARGNYDLIHVFMLRIAPFFMSFSQPKVIDLIDSMQLNLARRLSVDRPILRPFIRSELRRIKRYENSLHSFFSDLIFVSNLDAKFVEGSRKWVIPLGVDFDIFFPRKILKSRREIVFSGSMWYAPNVFSACWFAKKCFPELRRKIPDLVFRIVGGRPDKLVKELEKIPGVEVSGFVQSMADAISGSTIAVAPMFSGSGMQFKILEAMACGVPVVATEIGLGSIKAVNGRDLLVANSHDDFILAIERLLADPSFGEGLSKNAFEFVRENHSWEKAGKEIEKIYELAVEIPQRCC